MLVAKEMKKALSYLFKNKSLLENWKFSFRCNLPINCYISIKTNNLTLKPNEFKCFQILNNSSFIEFLGKCWVIFHIEIEVIDIFYTVTESLALGKPSNIFS